MAHVDLERCRVGTETGAIVSHKSGGILRNSAGAIVRYDTSAIVGDKATSVIGNKTPAIVGNKTPAIIGNKTPTIIGNKAAAVIRDQRSAGVSDKRGHRGRYQHRSFQRNRRCSLCRERCLTNAAIHSEVISADCAQIEREAERDLLGGQQRCEEVRLTEVLEVTHARYAARTVHVQCAEV